MSIRRVLAAAPLLALAACVSVLPKPPPPPELFRLTPTSETAAPARAVDLQLAVDLPAAPAALDSERIALTHDPLSLDYFADAAWTDRAPAMVQSLIIESLENAGRIRAVARRTGEVRADAALVTDLRRFEARYGGDGPPEVEVQFLCRIVRLPDRTVLAVRSFEGRAQASSNDLPEIVAAFNNAFHAAMGPLAQWTADSLAGAK